MSAETDHAPTEARVLVGESVFESAVLTVRDGWLYIEFDADDLVSVAVDLSGMLVRARPDTMVVDVKKWNEMLAARDQLQELRGALARVLGGRTLIEMADAIPDPTFEENELLEYERDNPPHGC